MSWVCHVFRNQDNSSTESPETSTGNADTAVPSQQTVSATPSASSTDQSRKDEEQQQEDSSKIVDEGSTTASGSQTNNDTVTTSPEKHVFPVKIRTLRRLNSLRLKYINQRPDYYTIRLKDDELRELQRLRVMCNKCGYMDQFNKFLDDFQAHNDIPQSKIRVQLAAIRVGIRPRGRPRKYGTSPEIPTSTQRLDPVSMTTPSQRLPSTTGNQAVQSTSTNTHERLTSPVILRHLIGTIATSSIPNHKNEEVQSGNVNIAKDQVNPSLNLETNSNLQRLSRPLNRPTAVELIKQALEKSPLKPSSGVIQPSSSHAENQKITAMDLEASQIPRPNEHRPGFVFQGISAVPTVYPSTSHIPLQSTSLQFQPMINAAASGPSASGVGTSIQNLLGMQGRIPGNRPIATYNLSSGLLMHNPANPMNYPSGSVLQLKPQCILQPVYQGQYPTGQSFIRTHPFCYTPQINNPNYRTPIVTEAQSSGIDMMKASTSGSHEQARVNEGRQCDSTIAIDDNSMKSRGARGIEYLHNLHLSFSPEQWEQTETYVKMVAMDSNVSSDDFIKIITTLTKCTDPSQIFKLQSDIMDGVQQRNLSRAMGSLFPVKRELFSKDVITID